MQSVTQKVPLRRQEWLTSCQYPEDHRKVGLVTNTQSNQSHYTKPTQNQTYKIQEVIT